MILRCEDCFEFQRLGYQSGFCYHIAELVDIANKACDHARICDEIHCNCEDVENFTQEQMDARYKEALENAY